MLDNLILCFLIYYHLCVPQSTTFNILLQCAHLLFCLRNTSSLTKSGKPRLSLYFRLPLPRIFALITGQVLLLSRKILFLGAVLKKKNDLLIVRLMMDEQLL